MKGTFVGARGGGPYRLQQYGRRIRARRQKRWRAGFTRTAGYYGRFSGAGAIENKFHDIDIDDALIAQNGTIQTPGLGGTASCNTIPQGVTEVQRIGRKCTIRQINWRWTIELAEIDGGTDPQNVEAVRVILYLDKQANGATSTVAGILESDDYQSFNNLANKSRFRILMDRNYVMTSPAGGGNGTNSDWCGNIATDSLYKKVNIPIEFDSTTGAITEIRSNNIGVLLLSKGGNLCSFASKMRLRFSDQ